MLKILGICVAGLFISLLPILLMKRPKKDVKKG